MKFSALTSTLVSVALIFASKVAADVDYFDFPFPNAQFRAGSCIQFYVDDMPDGDDDDLVFANLYRENGAYVKTIRTWHHDIDDDFAFTYCLDRNIRPGRYFVEIFAEDDDDDDIARSFVFQVVGSNSRTSNGIPPVRPSLSRTGYNPATEAYRYRRYNKRDSAAIEEQ